MTSRESKEYSESESSDICSFESEEDFKNCVYDYFCQCKSQCLDIKRTDNTDYFRKGDDNSHIICSQIVIDKNIDNYLQLITNAIKYLVNQRILIKRGDNVYYIHDKTTRLKFTWENIKSMENVKNKTIFWLFRKLVVDSIIKHILKQQRSNLKVYSVGSAKLESDYDITLYGNKMDKVDMIKSFDDEFKRLFTDNSAVVFDTNIYGKAYITFDNNEYKSKFKSNNIVSLVNVKECGPEFYYLNKTEEINSQLMWGLVKYLKDLREGFGENLYNEVRNYMNKKIESPLTYAHNVFVFLKNQPAKINYNSLLRSEEKFMNEYGDEIDDISKIHDYLSVLNFYGNETYFTRGAFIDTVINTQMCDNKYLVHLDEIDYITSILENAGFFYTHNNKSKYIIRVYKTLQNLLPDDNSNQEYRNKYELLKKSNSYISFESIIKSLETTVPPVKEGGEEKQEYDSKYCKNLVLDDEFKLLSCHKYQLFGLVMTIVCKMLDIYINSEKDSRLNNKTYFYYYFIEKGKSGVFKEGAVLSPVLEKQLFKSMSQIIS